AASQHPRHVERCRQSQTDHDSRLKCPRFPQVMGLDRFSRVQQHHFWHGPNMNIGIAWAIIAMKNNALIINPQTAMKRPRPSAVTRHVRHEIKHPAPARISVATVARWRVNALPVTQTHGTSE